MLRNLSQAATNQQTPATAYGMINTPYTPSGQTPYMTPFQTPHTSATPRYNGPFAHPGAPVSSRSFRESVSPYQFPTASPHARTGVYSAAAQESMDWQKASESWAAPRNKNSTPREMGRTTPRGRFVFLKYLRFCSSIILDYSLQQWRSPLWRRIHSQDTAV
jgi:transcription elongation factor SPT6